MTLIEIKSRLSTRDRVVFGLLWIVFFGVLALLALRAGDGLLWAAIITGVAVVVSLAFNTDHPRRLQALGLLFPLALLAIWAVPRYGPWQHSGARVDAIILGACGVIGGVVTLAFAHAGLRLYQAWMHAAQPTGWTIARITLALAFYLVFTPVGFALKLAGRDPLQRRFEPSATTYWTPRRQRTDPTSYIRQS